MKHRIGTICCKNIRCKYGYEYWILIGTIWKFIGYNKKASQFPNPSSMKRFIKIKHKKDIHLK
jgi:hypothetical protein